MSDDIEKKIKKEWITEALGNVNFTGEEKISEEVLDEEAVVLLNGTNMFDDAIYSYLKVSLRNFRKLRDTMIAGNNFTPSDYGEVLAAGRGEPSQEVIDEMSMKYNMVKVTKPPVGIAPAGISTPKFFGDDDNF